MMKMNLRWYIMKIIFKISILYVFLIFLLSLKVYSRYTYTYTINAYKLTLDTNFESQDSDEKTISNNNKINTNSENLINQSEVLNENEYNVKDEKNEEPQAGYNIQKKRSSRKKDNEDLFVIIKK